MKWVYKPHPWREYLRLLWRADVTSTGLCPSPEQHMGREQSHTLNASFIWIAFRLVQLKTQGSDRKKNKKQKHLPIEALICQYGLFNLNELARLESSYEKKAEEEALRQQKVPDNFYNNSGSLLFLSFKTLGSSAVQNQPIRFSESTFIQIVLQVDMRSMEQEHMNYYL